MKRLFQSALRACLALGFAAGAALSPVHGQGPVILPPSTMSAPITQAAASQPSIAPVTTNPAITTPASPATNADFTNEDIRDIRGPKPIPSPERWFLWLAGGAILAALAYGAWRWYRHLLAAPRLPYEIALARLARARALMTVPTAREFSIEVSEIVRSYIEKRFNVRAAHQTTEEFLHNLLEPSDALLTGHRELLGDFLHLCDLAKFARWVLSLEEMEEMYGRAHTFISETGKPVAPGTPAIPQIRPQTTGASA